jgi:hypothetical protein
MIIVIIVDMEVKLIVKVMKGSGEYMNKKRFTYAHGVKIVAIRDNGKIMNSIRVCELLNELSEENEELKQSVNNLKDTIIKITIAYQRKYDRNIVDLVHEVHDEDISDLIKELQE